MNESYSNLTNGNAANELCALPLSSFDPQRPPKKSTRSTAHGAKPADPRALKTGQAGVAWERLKRIVREHCLHPSQKRLSFHIYGGTISFQSALDGPQVELIREGDQLVKCVAGTEERIRMVRLKTKGVGFEYRQQLLTATRLIIEIVCEAREIAMRSVSQATPADHPVKASANPRRDLRPSAELRNICNRG
jgi:hypothetical protein